MRVLVWFGDWSQAHMEGIEDRRGTGKAVATLMIYVVVVVAVGSGVFTVLEAVLPPNLMLALIVVPVVVGVGRFVFWALTGGSDDDSV